MKIPPEKIKKNTHPNMSFAEKCRELSKFEKRNTSIKTHKSPGTSHKPIQRAVSNLYLFSVTW
jgi:hypothetical protein